MSASGRGRTGSPGDLAAVVAVLRAAGVPFRCVDIAGDAGDVLAIDADMAWLKRTRSLAPELRELGFRFVAIDLAGASSPASERRDPCAGEDATCVERGDETLSAPESHDRRTTG